MHPILLDAAGHRRQPVTLPGYHAGRPPRNKGRRYPADPPTVEEIVAVMRTAGAGPDGVRLRALVVLLWRAGLRIGEALARAETDLDSRRGAVLIRHGKGDKRREVGMDSWAWEQLEPWQQLRVRLPVGPLLCVIHGPTAGRNWEQATARRQLARTPAAGGVRRRFAPHQLRHAHAVELAHEQIPLVVIQRQLGHYAGDRVKGDAHDERRFALAASRLDARSKTVGLGVDGGQEMSKVRGRRVARRVARVRAMLDGGVVDGRGSVPALDVIGAPPDAVTSLVCGRARALRVRRGLSAAFVAVARLWASARGDWLAPAAARPRSVALWFPDADLPRMFAIAASTWRRVARHVACCWGGGSRRGLVRVSWKRSVPAAAGEPRSATFHARVAAIRGWLRKLP